MDPELHEIMRESLTALIGPLPEGFLPEPSAPGKAKAAEPKLPTTTKGKKVKIFTLEMEAALSYY